MSIYPRKRKDGGTVYQVRTSINGRRLPAKSFDTRKEAKAYEAELLSKPRFNGTQETCDSFANRWIEDYPVVKSGPTRGRRKSEGTNETNRGYLREFVSRFAGVRLADVDRQMARAFAVAHPRAAGVARNVFGDALDDGLVQANPFAALHVEQSKGRKDHDPLREEEFRALAETAVDVHGAYGPMFRAMVLFACYVGERLNGTLLLERDDVAYAESEVTFKNAKFDKTRTVLLLPEAAEALRSFVPLISTPYVFTSKRGKVLSKTNHYALWNPVRHAFLQTLTPERRRQIVDLDWHSLRHACGYHFYVTLGFSAEETAAQLGHADASLITRLYGHGKSGAIERMKQRMREAA